MIRENRFSGLGSLAIPNFRQLWFAQAISQVGYGMANLALVLAVTNLTGSTTALAAITITIALPNLVFGLLAGVYVDRWDRRRIMVWADLVRGVAVLAMVLVQRPDQVWLLFLLGFIQATAGSFTEPARNAVIPLIITDDRLLEANALVRTTPNIAFPLGSALAGLLVGLTGGGWPAFCIGAVTFLFSATLVSRMQEIPLTQPSPRQAGIRGTWDALADGLTFTFRRSVLVGVILTISITMLGAGAINVLFVPFLLNVVHIPVAWVGLAETGQIIGMALGGGLIATLGRSLPPRWVITIGMLGSGLSMAWLGRANNIGIVFSALLISGICLAPSLAAASTILQRNVPDEKRGRVGSANAAFSSIASILSMAYAGILGDRLGMRLVFTISGGIILAAGLTAAILLREPAKRQDALSAAIVKEAGLDLGPVEVQAQEVNEPAGRG